MFRKKNTALMLGMIGAFTCYQVFAFLTMKADLGAQTVSMPLYGLAATVAVLGALGAWAVVWVDRRGTSGDDSSSEDAPRRPPPR